MRRRLRVARGIARGVLASLRRPARIAELLLGAAALAVSAWAGPVAAVFGVVGGAVLVVLAVWPASPPRLAAGLCILGSATTASSASAVAMGVRTAVAAVALLGFLVVGGWVEAVGRAEPGTALRWSREHAAQLAGGVLACAVVAVLAWLPVASALWLVMAGLGFAAAAVYLSARSA